jgi:hypothetical protein
MIVTILTIWATGFFVMGTDRVCTTIRNPPPRAISTGEEVAMDVFASAFWPLVLVGQVKGAVEYGKRHE